MIALGVSALCAARGLSFPVFVFVASVVVYLVGRLALSIIHHAISKGMGPVVLVNGIDQAEKGISSEALSAKEVFQLEKRAFFSKTWLFVCHRSQFGKPGDYHTFEVAGISFFIVLGRDERLRAFHNVCRHRAYTVVRKSCGTSTRFSCKYHGWQYDDQGKLIKAPKFEESPGFLPEENGLFEVKLIVTREGMAFVNFDAGTMNLPFNNMKSNLDMGACTWLAGFSVSSSTNWKQIANEFSSQAQWSQTSFGWFSTSRKQNMVRLLGPLSMAKELDENLWCTVNVLPVSESESVTTCDLFAKAGRIIPPKKIETWKSKLEKELQHIGKAGADGGHSLPAFAYECGGRTIDLTAILAQHQRTEKQAQRKLQPAIRITGFSEADREAAALCESVDRMAEVTEVAACTKVSSLGSRLEW